MGTETISLCLCLILEESGLVSFLGRWISILLPAFPLLPGQKSTNNLGVEITFEGSQLFRLFLERIYFNFPDVWLRPCHPAPSFGYITVLSSAYRPDGLCLVLSKSSCHHLCLFFSDTSPSSNFFPLYMWAIPRTILVENYFSYASSQAKKSFPKSKFWLSRFVVVVPHVYEVLKTPSIPAACNCKHMVST